MPISEYVDIQKVNSQINEVILSKKVIKGSTFLYLTSTHLNEWLSNMKFKKTHINLVKNSNYTYTSRLWIN